MASVTTARKRQAARMKSRMQTAAMELFNRKGFENVTIDEIARTVGCSVGNIYHYFPNKDSLMVLLTEYVDIEYQELENELMAENIDARERLLRFSERALQIDSKEELLYQSFIHSIRNPEQGFLKVDMERAYFRILRNLIENVALERSLPMGVDTDEIMDAFVVMNRGILMEWRIEEGGFDIGSRGRRMAEVLLRGYIE